MLTVYVRKELNMRKGKMAAQVAHSSMKLFLEIMKKNNGTYILPYTHIIEVQKWISNNMPVEFKYVSGEEGLSSCFDPNKPYSKIMDRGLTEFNGIPTLTCGAQGIFNHSITEELEIKSAGEIKIKQYLVYSKEKSLTKENASILAAQAAILLIYNNLKDEQKLLPEKRLELDKNSAFYMWLNSAFAKIGLGIKNDAELEELSRQLQEHDINFVSLEKDGNKMIAIEPTYPEKINKFTSNLSLI